MNREQPPSWLRCGKRRFTTAALALERGRGRPDQAPLHRRSALGFLSSLRLGETSFPTRGVSASARLRDWAGLFCTHAGSGTSPGNRLEQLQHRSPLPYTSWGDQALGCWRQALRPGWVPGTTVWMEPMDKRALRPGRAGQAAGDQICGVNDPSRVHLEPPVAAQIMGAWEVLRLSLSRHILPPFFSCRLKDAAQTQASSRCQGATFTPQLPGVHGCSAPFQHLRLWLQQAPGDAFSLA